VQSYSAATLSRGSIGRNSKGIGGHLRGYWIGVIGRPILVQLVGGPHFLFTSAESGANGTWLKTACDGAGTEYTPYIVNQPMKGV
jgi:hypothetical protein